MATPSDKTWSGKLSLPELCPRCEEGVLVVVEVPYEVTLSDSTTLRIPKVQMEECSACGLRSLSGKEVRLFDVLFAPQYERIADLVEALKAAGFFGMFLRENGAATHLGFGSRIYVEGLAGDLRELYLDNESSHVLDGLAGAPSSLVPLELADHRYTLKLPKVGEGENGIVYDFQESSTHVLKLAKPRPYSRDHIRQECEVTGFYASQGIPVPGILEYDPYGSFAVKERLAGDALAVIYHDLGTPDSERHQRVRAAVERFAGDLLDLFVRHPEVKTSISPNNIFVVESDHEARCLLVDTGPAPMHDYSRFSFAEYWDVVVPEKIERYRAVGYI